MTNNRVKNKKVKENLLKLKGLKLLKILNIALTVIYWIIILCCLIGGIKAIFLDTYFLRQIILTLLVCIVSGFNIISKSPMPKQLNDYINNKIIALQELNDKIINNSFNEEIEEHRKRENKKIILKNLNSNFRKLSIYYFIIFILILVCKFDIEATISRRSIYNYAIAGYFILAIFSAVISGLTNKFNNRVKPVRKPSSNPIVNENSELSEKEIQMNKLQNKIQKLEYLKGNLVLINLLGILSGLIGFVYFLYLIVDNSYDGYTSLIFLFLDGIFLFTMTSIFIENGLFTMAKDNILKFFIENLEYELNILHNKDLPFEINLFDNLGFQKENGYQHISKLNDDINYRCKSETYDYTKLIYDCRKDCCTTKDEFMYYSEKYPIEYEKIKDIISTITYQGFNWNSNDINQSASNQLKKYNLVYNIELEKVIHEYVFDIGIYIDEYRQKAYDCKTCTDLEKTILYRSMFCRLGYVTTLIETLSKNHPKEKEIISKLSYSDKVSIESYLKTLELINKTQKIRQEYENSKIQIWLKAFIYNADFPFLVFNVNQEAEISNPDKIYTYKSNGLHKHYIQSYENPYSNEYVALEYNSFYYKENDNYKINFDKLPILLFENVSSEVKEPICIYHCNPKDFYTNSNYVGDIPNKYKNIRWQI